MAKAMTFSIQAILVAQPSCEQRLIDIMLKAAAVASGLKGCALYIVQQAMDDSTNVLVTEVWHSQADHQAALLDESVCELIEQIKPILQAIEHQPAEYLGGYGLPL